MHKQVENYLNVLAQGYTLSSGDTITNPGKFEGRFWSEPLLYELSLDSSNYYADYSWGDGDSLVEFAFSPEECLEYEIDALGAITYVSIYQDSQGFVYMSTSKEAFMDDREDYEF